MSRLCFNIFFLIMLCLAVWVMPGTETRQCPRAGCWLVCDSDGDGWYDTFTYLPGLSIEQCMAINHVE